MQMSADGFVGEANGGLDWMTWNWDDALKTRVDALTDSIDTILLGRKMTEGFIAHWEKTLRDNTDPSQPFARKMVNAQKYVFSRTLQSVQGENTTLVREDAETAVHNLKKMPGKNIMVYGGAGFVSFLLEKKLIDELHLFINPAALGDGLRIFSRRTPLQLNHAHPFACGIVEMEYSIKQ